MALGREFMRFSCVGGMGFVIDVSALYLLRAAGFDLYLARLISFTLAATATWIGNRRYTFVVRKHHNGNVPGEWLRYVLAMSFGGMVNYGVYAVLIFMHSWFRDQPWLAVAAGTGAGLLLNFILARRLLGQRAG